MVPAQNSVVPERRARYRSEPLRQFMFGVLQYHGLSEEDAGLAADSLIDADLSGTDTHGIVNFPTHWHYIKGLELKAVKPRPEIAVLRDSPVAASWDADRGFGPVVAHRAMSAAIDKARHAGIGMITVRNGCHFGALGYFARMAAAQDMIGMVMAHTAATTFAPGGLEPVMGTSPLAFAAPVAGAHPFTLDMATTTVAGSNLLTAQRRGAPLPPGWAVDAKGKPSTSPDVREQGGSLLYLGANADGGGYKGYGLAMMVDIMSGMLSGTGSGLWQHYSPEWQQGQWFAAWRIDAFTDPDAFKAEMKKVIDHIHDSKPAIAGEVVTVPGDRGAATRIERSRSGIALDQDIVDLCLKLGAATGVPFPEPNGKEL